MEELAIKEIRHSDQTRRGGKPPKPQKPSSRGGVFRPLSAATSEVFSSRDDAMQATAMTEAAWVPQNVTQSD